MRPVRPRRVTDPRSDSTRSGTEKLPFRIRTDGQLRGIFTGSVRKTHKLSREEIGSEFFGFDTVHSAGVPKSSSGGGRATGTYYLLRNIVVIPSAALGGYLWEFVDPEVAFTVAAIGVVGPGYFLLSGEEFEAYLWCGPGPTS